MTSKMDLPADVKINNAVPGTVSEYIEALLSSRRPGGQVVYHTLLEGSPPVYAENGFSGNDAVGIRADGIDRILSALGIQRLYSHQHAARSKVLENRHVVVATPTASGKTLVYNLPVLNAVMNEPSARALYLFPLKALAQDQLRNFNETAAAAPGHKATAAIYDGDTTAWRRKKIRENPPNAILTNPEMLHLGFLPHHDKWADFFSTLRYVVIDEVHVYRGVMGSHMAQVLRRLRRICALYGSDPVFIFCSATIANPAALASGLTGLDVTCIDHSGAPEGRRHLVFINPVEGAPRTANMLLKAALHRELRTIVYSQSRKMTELIAMWAAAGKGLEQSRISAYRAGFLPEERREIEAGLMSGELLAVISTSALELGIDIGSLDLCILVGYPGTVMATRQRGGRVGRSGDESAVLLVGGEDALDQYILRHAAEFIMRAPESAMVNPDNEDILAKHLVCAAAEHPFALDSQLDGSSAKSDGFSGRPAVLRVIGDLERAGKLFRSAEGTTWFAAEKNPQRTIDLRGSGSRFAIIDRESGNNMGEIDGVRAFRETHPGAIYLHHGRTFLVDQLDIEKKTVLAREANPNYYTRTRSSKQTEILAVYREKDLGRTRIFFGRLKVTDQVTGYEKWQIRDHKRINILGLDLPPQVFETEGFWVEIPLAVLEAAEKRQMHFMGGIHAMEHALIGLSPLFVLCDRNDLGGISITYHVQVQNAAVFVYDAFPGGIGLCRTAFEKAPDLIKTVFSTISGCECEAGCPVCVHSPKCGSGNRPIDKDAALFVLKGIMGDEDDPTRTGFPSVSAGPATGGITSEPRQPEPVSSAGTAREKCEPEQDNCRPAAPGGDSAARDSPVQGQVDTIRYGVLDIETRLSAEEVGGWGRAHQMGISCAVVFDSLENEYLTFLQEDVKALVDRLAAFDLVVGFNLKRFDYAVIGGLIDYPFHSLPTLDILEHVHTRLGYRLSLDHIAHATLGRSKSADGLAALSWWKEGKMDQIVSYCKEDVEITKAIYLYGLANRYLLFRNKSGASVRLPVNW